MKFIVVSLALFSAGVASGYIGRAVIIEDRIQSNLASLSGESLSHLDDIAEFTRHFSPEEIERRWKEYQDFTTAGEDLTTLRESWRAWQLAIIFREVERVGWHRYRSLVIHHAAGYLSFRRHGAYVPNSDFARNEVKKAEEMIHEAIPADALAKSGPFH